MKADFWVNFWLIIGFMGQGLFTARFLVQWLVSEKKGAVTVPVSFWWLSLVGGTSLLSYAISRKDPVIIVGQAMGIFVYTRNMMLTAKAKRLVQGAGINAEASRRRGGGSIRGLHRVENLHLECLCGDERQPGPTIGELTHVTCAHTRCL